MSNKFENFEVIIRSTIHTTHTRTLNRDSHEVIFFNLRNHHNQVIKNQKQKS